LGRGRAESPRRSKKKGGKKEEEVQGSAVLLRSEGKKEHRGTGKKKVFLHRINKENTAGVCCSSRSGKKKGGREGEGIQRGGIKGKNTKLLLTKSILCLLIGTDFRGVRGGGLCEGEKDFNRKRQSTPKPGTRSMFKRITRWPEKGRTGKKGRGISSISKRKRKWGIISGTNSNRSACN